MTRILIVDDSSVDRRIVGTCLQDSGFDLSFAEDGQAALDQLNAGPPDLVLTDMVMPEVDGLELVKTIRRQWSHVPVILMTAHGSEETAVTALQTGAASYVPKKNLARDLEETVRNVLSVASSRKAERQLLESLTSVELRFELGNEISSLRPLIINMQQHLRTLDVCDEADIVRISTALQEALVNSIEHGNLEMDSALRDEPGSVYSKLAQQRRGQTPYCDRRVTVTARIDRGSATWTIRDEGPGFNPSSLPDPTDPANLQRVSGRGLLLIRTFMDEVSFNESANEITMVKYGSGRAAAESV